MMSTPARTWFAGPAHYPVVLNRPVRPRRPAPTGPTTEHSIAAAVTASQKMYGNGCPMPNSTDSVTRTRDPDTTATTSPTPPPLTGT